MRFVGLIKLSMEGRNWQQFVEGRLTKNTQGKGGSCPISGPKREGKEPGKYFNIKAFAKEMEVAKIEFGGKDETKPKENEIVDKRIITATV